MLVRLLSFLFIICSGKALQAHSSLFFTQEEIDFLDIQSDAPEKLNLSAIVYLDKEHWSLWINDKVIRPTNLHDLSGFTVEEVTPFEIKVSPVSPETSSFTLRPYETRL